jgi:4-hydroxy-tetrahydrodipicolinate reductase
MLRVAVAGALGRMGRVAVPALQGADGIEYAGGFARARVPGDRVTDDLHELLHAQPDVVLDLTTHPGTVEISMSALEHGVRPVIGATGWTRPERDALDALARERGLAAMLVPNFSIGACLMMRFAEEAARFFPTAEIIEMHHDKKKDAPSGTALLTAQGIAAAGGPAEPPIHSIRLRGAMAHQEVRFGTDGEMLTVRHDALSRESYVPGMLACVKAVMHLTPGLHVGMPFDALRPAQDDNG